MPLRTPLHDAHLAAGARMVEFAGWEMPVQYQGVLEEHAAVRESVGMFDVSHMGEVTLEGPRALRELCALLAPGGTLLASFLKDEAPASLPLPVAAALEAGQDRIFVLRKE